MSSLLVRSVRIVAIGGDHTDGCADLRIVDGTVVDVAPRLDAGRADLVVDAEGRWAIPGLWDQHVHFTQWAQARTRLDVSGTGSPAEVVRLVTARHAARPQDSWVFGQGFRLAQWDRLPAPSELDLNTAKYCVAVTSGDAHAGWLNSRACEQLGLGTGERLLVEDPWFEVVPRVIAIAAEHDDADSVAAAVADTAARGVVGVVDFEFGRNFDVWPARHTAGIDQLRVRASSYVQDLDEVLAEGWSTGTALTADALVTMGPLKIITDGSLNSRTAFCRRAYHDGTVANHGAANVDEQTLRSIAMRARGGGLELALHAIGDAAVALILRVFAEVGVGGSVEHAQLMLPDDIAQLASLGIRASVQPAHLLDDRDATFALWPERTDHCFAFNSLARAGAVLALGSDAPVAPLDPWLAMAAAVHRSGDDRDPWNPGESLSAAQALAASTDGQGTLRPGSRGDIVLLDDDPLRPFATTGETADHLRSMPVAATIVAGRVTHDGR